MTMPLFKRAPAGDAEGFLAAISADAITEDEMTVVRVAGKKIILTRRAGRLYAIDASPAGLMLLLHLPPGREDEEAVRKLAEAGIESQTLSGHFAGRRKEQGLLLSFAGFSEDDLRRSARKLIEVLDD